MDTGGGGVDSLLSFVATRTNLAFFEAEKLYNQRKSIDEPIKVLFNNKEVLYYSNCPLGLAFSLTDSIRYYPLTHTFLLKEYEKDGFNPKDGEVIFDCGGADGDTALFFSFLYPNSTIYSFECDENSYKMMQKNIQANNKQNMIHTFQQAIGEKTQTLHFESWHVVPAKTQTSKEVSCISIDDFVAQNNIANIGLIKMDIEGGEQSALLGAKNTILRFKPKLMIPIYHLESDIVEIPKILDSLHLPMEFSIKWTEVRWAGMDCVLFVRFV